MIGTRFTIIHTELVACRVRTDSRDPKTHTHTFYRQIFMFHAEYLSLFQSRSSRKPGGLS